MGGIESGATPLAFSLAPATLSWSDVVVLAVAAAAPAAPPPATSTSSSRRPAPILLLLLLLRCECACLSDGQRRQRVRHGTLPLTSSGCGHVAASSGRRRPKPS